MSTNTGLRLHEHEPDDFADVSDFIRRRFHQSYGATLRHLMPRLFSLQDGEGAMIAALGLREAARERLFMETYLDHPVEDVISRHAGERIPRNTIIEVGNLATTPGGARAMIVALTCYLRAHGFDWITFTGVATLRAAFSRLGMRPFVLAEADPARLSPVERECWGSYFVARPVVMGGYVPHGFEVVAGGGTRHAKRIVCPAPVIVA